MILFGGSGHCKVVLEILQLRDEKVECIYDENPKSTSIYGIPVYDDVSGLAKGKALICIGNNRIRKKIAENYPLNYLNAIHPAAAVSSHAKICSGTVVMANATINPCAEIGSHCIINTGAVIEHECLVGNYVHISPNASLAGNVSVGEGTHIGIGASVIQSIKIGKWAVIGAGAVIIKDVPDYATVVGNPGKVISIKQI